MELAGAIVLAFFAGRYTRRLILKGGGLLEEKTRPVLGAVLRGIATSVAIVVVTAVVVAGGSFVEFSPVFARLHWGLVKLALLAAAAWMLFGMTDLIATVVRKYAIGDGNQYGGMAVTIMQRIFRALVAAVLAIFLLENMLGFHIGALIAGFGIIGLALSLAGKETAQNLFGAFSIFINRPFVVGDWISFKAEAGEVEDVRMQSTHIRLLSGEMFIVSNMEFISNAVENLAMRKFLRREMNLALPYGTSPDKVDEAMAVLDRVLRSEEVVAEGKCDLEERPPLISFDAFGAYYLNLKVYYWYFIGDSGEELQRNHERGWFSYLDHCSRVNRAVLEAFDAHGIEFAFPTQTLEIERASAPG